MLKTGLCLLMCLMAGMAWGQEWQHYQLTDFPPPGQVRECSSVADTFGNIHHYFWCLFHPTTPRHEPLFYMRTDFYGNILTDTVRLNNFAGIFPEPRCVKAFSDGIHSWCMFGERVSPEEDIRGLFLTERDENGAEVMPPTLLGYDRAWDSGITSAVFDPNNNTFHVVGTSALGYYYRFTTSAETLQWQRPINGVSENYNTSMILSPADGRPWASMSSIDEQGDGHFLLVRFGEDTSQTIYEALSGSTYGPAHEGFGMDAQRNSDFRVGCDTVHMAYVRLDSTFQNIVDFQVLHQVGAGFTRLNTDAAGNCLILWSTQTFGLRWAYRRADGQWAPLPSVINADMYLNYFSIVTMDSTRFAFTATGVLGFEDFQQLRLYTYGFPPNDINTPKPVTAAKTLAVYPNPFGNSLQIEIGDPRARAVVIYDVLGRTVISSEFPQGTTRWTVSNPELNHLPSGAYYLTVQGVGRVQPIRMMHVK